MAVNYMRSDIGYDFLRTELRHLQNVIKYDYVAWLRQQSNLVEYRITA